MGVGPWKAGSQAGALWGAWGEGPEPPAKAVIGVLPALEVLPLPGQRDANSESTAGRTFCGMQSWRASHQELWFPIPQLVLLPP